ncbi:N-acetylmuramoyl-L-alanine amidase [Clostridium formicaceticum]|uniref:N-acetylmuramoyl-L-alanine amidase LytC n=1 Tax=Clostridium formicaceticum TaxID=1497 RepID=A0AAC9WEW1_9CLOT|nr:N-acetylmuramoyl-L-alanine amidase [Clostridium formicaceticum]AOY75830.1 hypothetical protein BJL90_07895 [Clostridium formicaceticum]ARE86161.1 N-acetylmuramoyl-L-alanine amidase LytC precursor [Clostridium formicaceticum]
MKKIFSIVLLFIILFTSFTYANPTNNLARMVMDGKTMDFHIVQLNIEGKPATTDVPAVLHEARTLVPIHTVRSMGIDVEWKDATKEVIITAGDKTIVLKIDSPIAMVNDVAKRLPSDVPPKILTYQGSGRTMVPIAFLRELGLEVAWNEKTRTVSVEGKQVVYKTMKGIQVNTIGNTTEIRVKGDQQLTYSTSELSNPARVVFNFSDTKFDLDNKSRLLPNGTLQLEVNQQGIRSVRAAQFSLEPMTTRVTVELESMVKPEVFYDNNTNETVIQFVAAEVSKNYVKDVKADISQGGEVIIIQGDNIAKHNIERLHKPERLIIDIASSSLDPSKNLRNLQVNSNLIRSIDIVEMASNETVRLVVDLQEKDRYGDYKAVVESDRLLVYLDSVEGNSSTEVLQYREVSKDLTRLELKTASLTQYAFSVRDYGATLQVVVSKEDVELPIKTMEMNDAFVQKISISEDTTSREYIIVINLQENTQYRVISPNYTRDYIIEFLAKNNNRPEPSKDPLIVIDAGHGGTDPGAISPINGLMEKNLVLDVAQRLNKLLTEAGFRTYMTRETDTSVSLADRAAVANQLGADLFVSVHANAAGSASARGIENLYYPSEINANDDRPNKKLAEIFQREMIKITGAHSRSIVPRDRLVVLRDTKMPAVLSEIGFLTNPEEVAKLATSDYKQLIAEGMFQGIVKYFEEVK